MLSQLAATDLRALAVFETVAGVGGYEPAQDVLGVSQSTISIQISNLETRLGFKLCERGRAGFRLSSRGKIVLEAYAQLKFAMTEFQDKVNILSTSAVGSLRLGLLDHTLSETSLPLVEVMQRFQKAAPEARVEIVQGIQSDLRVAVLEDRIDMAIGAFDTRSEAIAAQWLYTERQHLYCGVGHRFFDRASAQIPRSEVEAADWVKRGYSLGAHVTHPVEIVYSSATAANIEAVALLILAGQHIGHLPEHFARPYEEAGQIRRISPETMSLDLDFFLISRKNRRDTSTMEVFRLAINETMS